MLQRRLGLFDAAAIIVSNVIGGGILLTRRGRSAAAVLNPHRFLATWLAGGMLAFAGRWRRRSSRRCAASPAASMSTCARRSDVWRRSRPAGHRSSPASPARWRQAPSPYVLRRPLHPVERHPDATPLFVVPLPYVPLTVSKQALVALAAIAGMA